MSINLLPCPFCGHENPEFERMGDRHQSCIVVCGWCGARHESSDEGDRCGSSWNQRAEPGLDGLRTSLETALARIEDMLADDDGQAFKEARKFLDANRPLSATPSAPTAVEPVVKDSLTTAAAVEPRDERAEFEAYIKGGVCAGREEAAIWKHPDGTYVYNEGEWQARASKGTPL